MLIVAGDTAGELLAAARALVTRSAFPQHAGFIAPRDVAVPALERRSAPRWLATDTPAPIGMYTSADRLTLQGSGSVNIYFRLPPDLFLRARPSVPLLLKFEYSGAAQGGSPAAHIRLNGQDVDTIRLRPSPSRMERADIVRLPTGTLRAYANTLTVDFDFGRRNQPTDVAQSSAIRRDSSIDLRGLPHSVVLPRLELFADAGFPFTEWPDLGRTAVVLPNAPTLADDEALLELAGFFGAQTGAPATSIVVTDAGTVDAARDRISSCSALLGRSRCCPRGPPACRWSSTPDGPRVNPQRTLLDGSTPSGRFAQPIAARLAASLAAGPRLDIIVQQFVSPFRRDRSVVAIVPGEHRAIARGGAAPRPPCATVRSMARVALVARRAISVLPRRQPGLFVPAILDRASARSSSCSSTIGSCRCLWCCWRSSLPSRSAAPPNVWPRDVS